MSEMERPTAAPSALDDSEPRLQALPMRPWQHAKASARRGGRTWQGDLAMHELVDVTKMALPDLRHRMVLHNHDLGPEIVARAFPELAHAREVARVHAREDLGADVPLRTWLTLLDPARLPRLRTHDLDALLEDEQRRTRVRDPDVLREVLALLGLPAALVPDEPQRAWAFLAHGAGLAIVRRVLGPARLVASVGGEVVFDPAHCAESIVHRMFRRLPDLRELASALTPSYRFVLEALEREERTAS